MFRTLDPSMLNIGFPIDELIPLAARYGLQAVSAPASVLESEEKALAADKFLKDNGLRWGLMPMPADFYHWDLDDAAFEKALIELGRRAKIAEKIGLSHAYNHVWPTGPRPFDENFEWHVRRVKAVSDILSDHGVHYGLEFLGPHELRTWQKYEFVHSLAGVLSIADEAGGKAGIAFDTFHWYCSGNGNRDDLMLMRSKIDRLVAVHMNDAVAGVPYDQQKDMQRRLPMETGLIDARDILAMLMQRPNNALYMIEPFEPARTLFHSMDAETAVRTAAEIFERIEK